MIKSCRLRLSSDCYVFRNSFKYTMPYSVCHDYVLALQFDGWEAASGVMTTIQGRSYPANTIM